MAPQNHSEHYRPLRGGIVVVAATRQHFGTLGMVATHNGIDRWGLTCGHVLGPVGGPVPQGDFVFQPDNTAASFRVGATVAAKSNQTLDCAAFLIDAAITTSKEILGIGTPSALITPVAGMRVIKSGRSTEITEGVINTITGAVMEIKVHPDFPAAYDLSDPGDSGAVWFEMSSRSPVGLHRAGTTTGPSFATAVNISAVLASLGLSMLP